MIYSHFDSYARKGKGKHYDVKNIYPLGRLERELEGDLLTTNNKVLKYKIDNPEENRIVLLCEVQVMNIIDDAKIYLWKNKRSKKYMGFAVYEDDEKANKHALKKFKAMSQHFLRW